MNNNYIRSVGIDWTEVPPDSYYARIPALAGMGTIQFTAPVTLFCGENGTGKSTLLEAIAVAYGFNPEGGTRNYSFSTYGDVSSLSRALRLVKGPTRPAGGYFFRAESFFNVATKAKDYWSDGESPYGDIHAQSHGEGFLSFFGAFERSGLYLMDEPEAALSPQHQLSLLARMHDMAQTGSQFVVATHSPILLGLPGAAIYSFDEGSIQQIPYEHTQSYLVTEMFINRRGQLLDKLL